MFWPVTVMYREQSAVFMLDVSEKVSFTITNEGFKFHVIEVDCSLTYPLSFSVNQEGIQPSF